MNVFLNDVLVATLDPGSKVDPLVLASPPSLPWSVDVRTRSGYLLAGNQFETGGDASYRFPHSCGPVDIWSRVPVVEPPSKAGEPGDCGPPDAVAGSPARSPVPPSASVLPFASSPPTPNPPLSPGAAITWSVGDAPAFAGSDVRVDGLVPWRHGFAAVGSVGINSTVWVSDASGRWMRVAVPTFAGFDVTSLAASDDLLLAIGSAHGQATKGAAWVSGDGISWMPVTMPEVFSDAWLLGVVHGPAGFLVFGTTADHQQSITALSSDGENWVVGHSWSVADAAPSTTPLTEDINVTVSSLGYLAWLPIHEQPSWLSSDGLHWTQLTGTNAESIQQIQSGADGYVASVGPPLACRTGVCLGLFFPSYLQSFDGTTWTDLTPQKGSTWGPALHSFIPLSSDGSTFLLIDDRGRAWSSTSGLDWQSNPVYLSDAGSVAASGNLHFSQLSLGLSGLADFESHRGGLTPWLATFSTPLAQTATPFPPRYQDGDRLCLDGEGCHVTIAMGYYLVNDSPQDVLVRLSGAVQGTVSVPGHGSGRLTRMGPVWDSADPVTVELLGDGCSTLDQVTLRKRKNLAVVTVAPRGKRLSASYRTSVVPIPEQPFEPDPRCPGYG